MSVALLLSVRLGQQPMTTNTTTGLVTVDDGSTVPENTLQIEVNGQVQSILRTGTPAGNPGGRFFRASSLRPGNNVVAVSMMPTGYYLKSMT